ncbi:MAG: LptF/LptG family permease [Deltaproteobacteria bacterium]|nr:LptF/LptG family permease [Deltaproteobacteria bacterium]
MNSLFRYLLRLSFSNFAITFLAGIGLFEVIDLFERVDSLLQHHPPLSLFLLYFIYKLPFVMTQIAPAAVLITIVLTMGYLLRHREWLIFQSSGVHPLRIFLPLYTFAFIVSLGTLFIQELAVPFTQYRSEWTMKVQIQQRKPLGLYRSESVWYRDGNNFYYIKLLLHEENSLRGITILTLNDDFQVMKRTDAASAHYTPEGWALEEVWIRFFENGKIIDMQRLNQATGLIPQTPADFETVIQKAETMTHRELSRFIRRLESEGFDAISYRVDWHARLSTPWSGLALALVAPFIVLLLVHRGGIFTGIGLSFVLGFLYWLSLGFSLSLGRSGILPPIVSAWSTHLLFCILGAILARRLKWT